MSEEQVQPQLALERIYTKDIQGHRYLPSSGSQNSTSIYLLRQKRLIQTIMKFL